MTAKGKINASKVQAGDRIIVRDHFDPEGHVRVNVSGTKTGEGTHIARVVGKDKAINRRGYLIRTTAGDFYADSIQTMWLAPEDAAGIKRAHVEALAEDILRDAADRAALDAEIKASGVLDDAHAEALAEDIERDPAHRFDPEAGASFPEGNRHPSQTLGMADEADERDATSIATDPTAPETLTQQTAGREVRERTGSAVVALLEHVWGRIQADHPDLPDVVIVTGSGLAPVGSKWGHFRADGWKAEDADRHELFIAGEALAKGGKQVVQTMLHEAAHTLARVRGKKDTSRQGRWHSRVFVAMAEELGMEHLAPEGDKSHGYSFVTMTEATLAKHADLIADLDREISLTCHLPGWLGGEAQGGERITGRPAGGAGQSSGPMKLTCRCDKPTIIRASKTVAESLTVKCDVCDAWFMDRS